MRAVRSMWTWKWPLGGLVLVGGGLLGANLLLTALLGLFSGVAPMIPARVTEAALVGLFVPWIALYAAMLGTALVALRRAGRKPRLAAWAVVGCAGDICRVQAGRPRHPRAVLNTL